MMPALDKKAKRHFWATTLWLLLPTIAISFYIFKILLLGDTFPNLYPIQNTVFLGISMVAGALFYTYRFRLIPTLLLLCLILKFGYHSIEWFSSGEFQSFYISILFIRLSLVGLIGWLLSYCFLNFKRTPIYLSIIGVFTLIPLLANNNVWYQYTDKVTLLKEIGIMYAPIIAYCIYIIVASNIIFNLKDRTLYFWQSLHKRIAFLVTFIIIIITSIWLLFDKHILNSIEGITNNNQFGENSLLIKKQPDNKQGQSNQQQQNKGKDQASEGEGLTMNELLKVGGSNSKSNLLLFAAYIDNFIPQSNTPNPLYLAMYYYTLFDEKTETFLIDSLPTPDKDYFKPAIENLPLYFTKTDSSVLQFSAKNLYQKVVDIELYKTNVDVSVFTAPTTAFQVQPITIEKNYTKNFRSAYKSKSVVSELNSAYFIYNIDNPIVRAFQEQRFEILRAHNDYSQIDSSFLQYYTQFPNGKNYDSIKQLAYSLATNKTTVIDKVLAIKNHFLARDKQGKRIFQYSDNPGIPELPSASRLNYFLFDNKKGYCAYYAGATLYMLRAMNIPSRIVGGFLTEDRASDNNKGWYWYYADQAHAWVQVYFPELGWIDFDTTIDNEDARESPQADGTPPIQPPKPTLVIDGKFSSIDTVQKQGHFEISKYIIADKEVIITKPIILNLDLSKAILRQDTASLPISKIDINDSITGITFHNLPLNVEARLKGEHAGSIVIDELHARKIKVSPNIENQTAQNSLWNKTAIKWVVFGILLIAGIAILFFSYFKWLYLKRKANIKNQTDSALLNNQFTALQYYLQKLQLIYDPNMVITAKQLDHQFNVQIARFIKIYQQAKYSSTEISISATEKHFVSSFLNNTIQHINLAIPKKKRYISFLFN